MEKSSLIGEILAKRAKDKNIVKVYFDRGNNKYHGRVKKLAESEEEWIEILICQIIKKLKVKLKKRRQLTESQKLLKVEDLVPLWLSEIKKEALALVKVNLNKSRMQ